MRNFRQLFRNYTTAQKPVCIYANVAYLELKKKSMCLPQVSSIFKKISTKTFGQHCLYQYLHHKQLKLLRLPVPRTVISNLIYIKATEWVCL